MPLLRAGFARFRISECRNPHIALTACGLLQRTMSANLSNVRHVRGFDVIKPLSIAAMIAIMLPLVLLPLASIFIFGTSSGFASFWAALTAPEAVFALKLSIVTSFWATIFNVVFGLFAAYVLSKYNFWGRNALIVIISLPTAIPTAVAGFSLLLRLDDIGVRQSIV